MHQLTWCPSQEIQTKPRPQRKESPTQNAKIELLHSEPLIANDKSLESLIVNDRSPDHRWILNCTLRSGNGPDHEKFIVTYIQLPNQSYRVTVSCDYRNAEPDSLEAKLKETQYQDDKGRDIYDSIRTSLPDIHFYDTVTSLRLETIQNRLHIHVTEDVDEAIPYPPRMAVAHVLSNSPTPPMEVTESELEFDCHLAGFVYGVSHGGKEYVKKEIPGPDAVDEFLYEVNALNDLNGSKYVIRLEAIVVDDSRQFVKGLLISRAQQGALVDLLYNRKGKILWEDRMRWAQQIVRGLSHIHKGGYVQGDFTLSNIVVDHNSDAWIIDINRRGCPVGWEPPEFAKKIESDQRISMHIGEKSDIYQAGMTLWALAMGIDEPETHGVPLSVNSFPEGVPVWYRSLVSSCLAPRPQDRPSATELVDLFLPSPSQATNTTMPTLESRKCLSGYPSLDFLTSLKSDCSEPCGYLPPFLIDLISHPLSFCGRKCRLGRLSQPHSCRNGERCSKLQNETQFAQQSESRGGK